MRDLTRVVVVGTSGSGKTTFARELALIVGAPYVELDALHWGPNWTIRNDFVARVADEAAKQRWVVDGNYSLVRDVLWSRATTIVWLNYSFAITFGRALWRTARRVVSGERLYADNRESLRNALFDRESILWWVLRTYRRRRRDMPRLMQRPEYAHVEFIVMNSPSEAASFLAEARSRGVPCC